jgi:eukaryotic-like serine/threonine-protein kinase
MGSSAGIRVGRYEIVSEIGRGAMGIVYQAKDPHIDRTIALKTISFNAQNEAEDADYRERFLQEAKAVGRLSHPGIVTIFDAGEDPDTGEPYIVMEYVQGESLHSILAQEEKLTLKRALQITQEIAEALHYAHSQGVVHRDIKPANILITSDGHAKIADFGIARLNMAQATLPGEILGSPAYMAPEQLRGDGIDPRSDLFSAGVILYNMLTGFRPFQGDSATAICYKVVNRNPIYVSSFDASFPAALDRIVSKSIAKIPEERFQSGSQMADAIAEFLHHASSRENPDFLKEVIEQHNLVPVFRELSTEHPPTLQERQAQKTPAVKPATNRNIWLYAVALGALIIAIAGVLIWRIENAKVPSLVVSQTIPAPTINVLPVTPQPPPRPVAIAVPAAKTTTVPWNIEVEHPFQSAKISVWLDQKLVLEQPLHDKRRGIFKKGSGIESIKLNAPSGEHHVQVQVQSLASVHFDETKKIVEIFDPKNSNVLHVRCDSAQQWMRLGL